MTPEEFTKLVSQAIENGSWVLPESDIDQDFVPLADLVNDLLRRNRMLHDQHLVAVDYIRQKINQMLEVIGTVPLRTEELDEKNLIALDPLGIISQSFSQILAHSNQTNKRLQLAKDEIQAIFESVGGGLLVLDQDRRIISCNSEFKEMFYTGKDEVIGKACYEVVCGDENHPEESCAVKKMKRSGLLSMQPDWCYGDQHFRVVASPIKDSDGKIIRSVVLYVDITELIQVRVDLAEEKERLIITLESIADGVVATDKDGRVTLMNKMAEELTGRVSEDAVGSRISSVMEIVDESSQKSCWDFFADLMQHTESRIERIDETTLIDANGLSRSIYLSAAPIHHHDRSVAGTIIVFRDITRKKRLEEELAKATRLESLGIFAGGIAHDFNNLLTGVLGNVSLAKALLSEDDEIFRLLNETEKSSYRAKGLTQQLLTFAKGGAPVKSRVVIGKLLKESVPFCLRGSSVKYEFFLPEEIWQVEVDEGQINQVVQNLVINGAQAMANNGILKIFAENVELDEDGGLLLSPGKYVKIAFVDQGVGINEKDLDIIFDPFYTTKEGGSGLGLATCYSIVSKHHGLITVDSTPGAGSTFNLYLPAMERQEVIEEKKSEPGASGKGRVLVMDDEELIRTVTASMLEFGGYISEMAVDGKEALEKYKKAMAAGTPFDVVLMDLTIPGGMGGKETIVELLKIDPAVKAIVSSGYANDPIMADHRKYGFCRVIPKPYKMQELNQLIAAVIPGNE